MNYDRIRQSFSQKCQTPWMRELSMVQTWMKDFFLLREPCLSVRFVFHTSELLFKVLSAKESQVRMCLQIKIYYNTKQHGKSPCFWV